MSKTRALPPANGATRTEAVGETAQLRPSKRRPLWAALLGVALLGALAGAVTLPGMRRETQRREAYLPQLERQAVHDPEDGPLLALVGARRMEAGENAGAADALRHAIADGESNEVTWDALAAAVAASGDRPRALADLNLGVAALPSSAALQGALARARVEDPHAPTPVLAQAIDPDGPAPLLARYAAGSGLNGFSEWWGRLHPESSGAATRQAWARERPGNAQAQRLWGEALLRNRRLPEARLALDLALSLAPTSPAIHLALADYWEQAGMPSKATLQYIAALKLRPDWLPALMGLGGAASQVGLSTYAGPAFERATQIAPQSADAWIGLGRAYVETNASDKGKAVAAFATASRLAPDRTDFLPDYANALRLNERWDDAEAVLRRRLAAAPGDAFCHFLLGLTLIDNHPTPAREAEGEAETREALRLTPHAAKADVQLAEMLLRRHQVQDAIVLLKDALANEPYNEKAMKILARAYQQTGQTQQAQRLGAQADALTRDQQQVPVLESKAGADPLNVALLQQLATLRRRIGAEDKARREEAMIHLIRRDPKQAAQQVQSFGDLVRSVLPTPAAAPK